MTQIAYPEYVSNSALPCGFGTDYQPLISTSRDGSQFVTVVQSGDLSEGVNRYRMLQWRVDQLGDVGPSILLEMNSSSTEPGIDPASIVWEPAGNSLTFLGDRPGQREEVYRLRLPGSKLETLAASHGSIISYGESANGRVLVYESFEAHGRTGIWNRETRRNGLVVTNEALLDVTLGSDDTHRDAVALFVKNRSGLREIRPLPGSHFSGTPFADSERNVSVSPNGDYAVVPETIPDAEPHPAWLSYRDVFVRYIVGRFGLLEGPAARTRWSYFSRYVLINLKDGSSRVLLDAPFIVGRPVVWSPGGDGVLISHTLLPVVSGMTVREVQQASTRIAVEVGIRTGAIVSVDAKCDQAIGWDISGLMCSTVQFSLEKSFAAQAYPGTQTYAKANMGNGCHRTEWIRYRKRHGAWREVSSRAATVDVFDKESRNSPPELYYRTRGEKRAKVLVNLNPKFRKIKFSQEHVVSWEWAKGKQISAGLYLPVNYRRDRRYPLVIQTHGFNAAKNRFEFWGTSTTSDGAQALAGRGMVVLQVADGDSGVGNASAASDGQLREVERALQIYKSGIAYLSGQGLVDPEKVGIIGWSNTCFFVKWALTHAPTLFAAASVAEGGDGSYTEYMLDLGNGISDQTLYDAPPFGGGLANWTKNAPNFLMDRVRAPLLLVVLHNEAAILEWEWLNGLRELRKPVEMIVLDGRANDGHSLQEPWDVMTVSEKNVDWFDFWLNGHEDPDPAAKPQYARWRELRGLNDEEHQGGRNDAISWSSIE